MSQSAMSMALIAQAVDLVRRKEAGAEHALPVALGGERIFADQHVSQVLDGLVDRAAPVCRCRPRLSPRSRRRFSTLTMKYLRLGSDVIVVGSRTS